MVPEIAMRYLLSPIFPIFVALMMWPSYHAAATWWHQVNPWSSGERGFFTISIAVLSNVTYVTMHGLFALIEYRGWMRECKIERRECQRPSRQLILATLKQTFLNGIISKPLMAWFALHPLLKWVGSADFDAPRPSVLTLYLTFMVSIFCTDFGFYWVHRILHTKALYKIHKLHHEWHGPMSIAADFGNPIDMFFSNVPPVLLGCIVMKAHFLTLFAWVCVRAMKGYETHCGYVFRSVWLQRFGVVNWENTAHHDYHHATNCGNFGVYWLDWIFGTMDSMVVSGGLDKYIQSKKEEVQSLALPKILGNIHVQASLKEE